jgi:hypothetical protein
MTANTSSEIAEDPNSQDYIVRLKSREFVPDPGVEPDVEMLLQSTRSGERVHALVQFWHIPSDIDRANLEIAGVELLAYVPENTWFVSLPAGSSLQSEELANTRWIGAIQPEDRMGTNLDLQSDDADGTAISLEVRFFADVTTAEAKQLLTGYDAVIEAEAPEFHRFTVSLNRQAISSLANEDSVQWITEAAPPKTIHN